MHETDLLSTFRGVGEKTEKLFNRMGVFTAGDILLFFPRTYRSYPPVSDLQSLQDGEKAAVTGIISAPPALRRYGKKCVAAAAAVTADGPVELLWFGMPYIRNAVHPGIPCTFYGTVRIRGMKAELLQPEIFVPEAYETLTHTLHPVYRLTKGLSNKTVEKTAEQALARCLPVQEDLPEELVRKHGFPDRSLALSILHFPENADALQKAERRLSYTEFLKFFLAELSCRNNREDEANRYSIGDPSSLLQQITSALPYALTPGQENAVREILDDFRGPVVTERLIEGDVGSGKTVIAFIAMAVMASAGYQAAIMAPTEVLARQHEKAFQTLTEEAHLPFRTVFLSGSVKGNARKAVLSSIRDGSADFIVGTNALIQEGVDFHDLGLVVTDEQHRFGVAQRSRLLGKGGAPFSIVMSATPIPRTLALILYSGMRVSVIRDVPARRKRTKTAVIGQADRKKAWQMIASEVHKGHQAYVICPLVEESEGMEGENVTDYCSRFREAFHGMIRTEILHGRMKPAEKDSVMERFASGAVQVLVSTTVVEVGVNVPNATVMMIENADHFGLAQLHQLRGRVGRGEDQSYCILVNSAGKDNKRAAERLSVLTESTDGFEIAEKDLAMRGPGDARGIRQSGEAGSILTDMMQDADLLAAASADAEEILAEDPDLSMPAHAFFRKLSEEGQKNIYTNL